MGLRRILVFLGGFFLFFLTSCGTIGSKIAHRRGADPDIVIRHFEENMGPAKECADQLLRKKAKQEGHITFQWTVNDKGEVLDPMVTENTLGDGAVGDCFLRLLRQLEFPPMPLLTKTTVLYTFKFLAPEETSPSSSH